MYFKRFFSLLSLLALTLLAVSPALAQGVVSGDDNENPPDEGCANPTVIETFSGTENQRTPEFDITGDTFRLSYDVEVTDPNGFPVLEADVLDESGQPIGEGFLTFEEDGSEVVLAEPGTFSLEIRADDVEYTITVEDCVGDGGGGGGGNNNGGDDGDGNNDGIIDDTIPDKILPITGGLPLMAAGGVFLLSVVGLVAAWRSKEQ